MTDFFGGGEKKRAAINIDHLIGTLTELSLVVHCPICLLSFCNNCCVLLLFCCTTELVAAVSVEQVILRRTSTYDSTVTTVAVKKKCKNALSKDIWKLALPIGFAL